MKLKSSMDTHMTKSILLVTIFVWHYLDIKIRSNALNYIWIKEMSYVIFVTTTYYSSAYTVWNALLSHREFFSQGGSVLSLVCNRNTDVVANLNRITTSYLWLLFTITAAINWLNTSMSSHCCEGNKTCIDGVSHVYKQNYIVHICKRNT